MVEVLVVVVILGILVSIVSVASSSLINQSRANNTKAVITVVSDAIQEFKREKPSILKVTGLRASDPTDAAPRPLYVNRYGQYPPDELEVFTAEGIPGAKVKRNLAPGGATIEPKPPYRAMLFHDDSNPEVAKEHRDLAAMIVAIETLTESVASMLDKIPDRNRTAGAVDPSSGDPVQYLDRNKDGKWDSGDFQIRYIVDDWGVPLSYMAQRDRIATAPVPPQNLQAAASTNHAKWNEASTEIIRLNGGEPLVFSYGPDGKEQLTRDFMDVAGNPGAASLVGDYMDLAQSKHTVDHPMNADNIYLDPALPDKLAGSEQQQ